eukprot:TRINITY_DN5325_c0_g1_i10.p1 TRINITY_DN5325_c0_g1~~TRINITY_DN5325_c0_g1_i10.p1  ORF type:complete len:203 (-),score=72.95 TRINITY_DN5325_c0_g1_i10:969-1577(-)
MSSKKSLLKIIILGDSGVGKTSLMHQYVSKKFDNRYKATIGADFLTKDVEINGQPVSLQIWDTAGQERFQSLGSAFYRGADACILVFDLTQADSFSHLSMWIDEFQLQAGVRDCVLIGNKVDLVEKRAVSQKAAVTWCQNKGDNVKYFETSAKDSTGVESAFLAVATQALNKKKSVDEDMVMPKPIDLNKKQTTQKKEGCPC